MALLPWQKGIVTKIEKHTHNTRRFFIKVPGVETFNFKPGQFVTLDLPIHEKINKRLRSYSIASAPAGNNEFELLIVQAKDGLGTGYLFNEIAEGSEVTFRGPAGNFTLPENINSDLYLICTGTGIAPFRSMVQHIFQSGVPHKNIYLIFGTRFKNDLLYYEELTAMQQTLPGFAYIPTLSRQKWEGKTGYVHEVYKQLLANKPDADFYLCGWRNMVDEAEKNLLEMGYPKQKIHLELFG